MTFVSTNTLRKTQQELLRVMERLRPVTLRVFGSDINICAREGVGRVGLEMPMGAAVDTREGRFYIRRSLLSAAPVVGTIYQVVETGKTWRLKSVDTGHAMSDPLWTLVCEQEDL
jgi:hypothetical protein